MVIGAILMIVAFRFGSLSVLLPMMSIGYVIALFIYLYFGVISYLISAILNIIVLKYLPYSVVLPLTSITYIWSIFIAYYFLNKKITKMKIYGVICIVIGAIFIAL